MEKIYAQVIINQFNHSIDKPFNYRIPVCLIKSIQIGQRVIVPFGMGNQKIDAFVINITNFCNITEGKIKDIEQIVEETPLLTKNQIKLACWMRNYYLCTYIEAIQVMIPSGLKIEKREMISLNTEILDKTKKQKWSSSFDREFLQYLFHKKTEVELEEIKKRFPVKDLKKQIKRLQQKEYIFIRQDFRTKIKDKEEKYIALSGKYKDKGEYLKEIRKGAYKQKQVLEYLEHFPCNYREFRKKLKVTSSTLKPLLEKNLIKITSKIIFRNPYENKGFKNPSVSLTKEQRFIIDEFRKLANDSSQKILIHGVTGSGKTEIYLNMIEFMLNKKKQSILLVPEISLTPQMIERVMGRFGEQVSILHSGLSNGEKYDQWKKIKQGKSNIVVGARSAIFAPLDKLGLIIIDEEHEITYKSSNNPRYHTIQIAEKRCEIENCHLVLGSATPSMESYYKGKAGKYHLYELKHRVKNIPMPKIELIDMRNELKEGNYSILSNSLKKELYFNLENKQQSILFLNRRGYSTAVSCRQCGYLEKCPHCDVSLTYHFNGKKLICHYCGYSKLAPKICPVCKSKKIKYLGTGTQKVQTIVEKEFPNAKILRMDVDTTRKKGAHQRIINSFKNQEADILIGTQMIAKGLDFPNVTLVGVIIADTSLNLPDYNSAERTFQLMTQVAGRSGRGDLLGKVIVQTYQPNHYSLIHAKNHDYTHFYNDEIAIRKEMLYPPFKEIINIVFSSENEKDLIQQCYEFYMELINHTKKVKKDLQKDIYKPVPSPVSKIKSKYRWHMIIKTSYPNEFKEILRKIYHEYLNKSQMHISIDINPTSIL